jgi:hypothetical protein
MVMVAPCNPIRSEECLAGLYRLLYCDEESAASFFVKASSKNEISQRTFIGETMEDDTWLHQGITATA